MTPIRPFATACPVALLAACAPPPLAPAEPLDGGGGGDAAGGGDGATGDGADARGDGASGPEGDPGPDGDRPADDGGADPDPDEPGGAVPEFAITLDRRVEGIRLGVRWLAPRAATCPAGTRGP